MSLSHDAQLNALLKRASAKELSAHERLEILLEAKEIFRCDNIEDALIAALGHANFLNRRIVALRDNLNEWNDAGEAVLNYPTLTGNGSGRTAAKAANLINAIGEAGELVLIVRAHCAAPTQIFGVERASNNFAVIPPMGNAKARVILDAPCREVIQWHKRKRV